MKKAEIAAALFFMLAVAGASLGESPGSARLKGESIKAIVVVDEVGGTLNSSATKAVITGDSVLGLANSSSAHICLGYLCIEFGPAGEVLGVTFLLSLNISGPAGDAGFVDTAGAGLYRAKDIARFFACVEDATLPGKPVTGIIAAGSGLKYIRLDEGASFVLQVSQPQPGNRFIVPVTGGGCGTIRNRFPLTLPLTPFILQPNLLNAVELILAYPFDLAGDFERTGPFTLLLEKNSTRIIGGAK